MVRLANGACWSVAFMSVSFSAMVLLLRQSMYPYTVRKDKIFGFFEAGATDRKYITRLLDLVSSNLMRKGVAINDLTNAASRLLPIESDLRNLNVVLESLQSNQFESGIQSIRDPRMQSICVNSVAQGGSPEMIRERIVNDVCDSWINRGYFRRNAFPNRSIFGNRETSEAVGMDIGCTISTSLDPTATDTQQLTDETLNGAARAIDRWGFTILRKAVTQLKVSALVEHLKLDQGSASKNGERIIKHDPNISHNRAMVNRLQLLIRGSKLETYTTELHTAFAPLLTLLQQSRAIEGEELMLSDVRLIIVDEGADAGNWSIFNPRGGFTVVLPLHDRDSRTGTFQIVPGSHFIANRNLPLFRRMILSCQRLLDFPFPISVTDLYDDGSWRAGDALVLDNRVLLRPEQNKVFRSGTYLLMKYETAESATPQIFVGGKILFRFAQLLDELATWVNPRL